MVIREYPRETPLLEGRLLRRYKRFLADVELADGSTVTAHCVNTGAMEGLTRPGNRVWLSRADNPKRKLAYTWELVEAEGRLYGCNTGVPNRLVKRLLAQGALPWLRGYPDIRPEQRYGENSRIDFHLRKGSREVYLEVKNCHLLYPDGRAYFPDAVSARATGHLRELAAVVRRTPSGRPKVRAEVLFVCQMPGVREVRPSDAHDPEFAATARAVREQGVGFAAIEVLHTPEAVTVTRRLPVSLAPYPVKRVAGWRKKGKEAW
jgi:sugar fermentation stimulation protein A